MTTSGTYTWSQTISQICDRAFRICQSYSSLDTPPAIEYTNAVTALNSLLKAMCMDGLTLECTQEVSVDLVSGQKTYTFPGAGGVTYKVLRVLQAFQRDTTSNTDVILTIIAREDYNNLGFKDAPGVPNQLFVDVGRDSTSVVLYDVPNDSFHQLHLVVQRPFQDVNLLTENVDLPQEALLMCQWNLAAELALEQGVNPANVDRIQAKAKYEFDRFINWNQENASLFLTPDRRVQDGA